MAGVFLSVVMFVMAGVFAFRGRDPVKRRLAGGRAEGEANVVAAGDPVSLRRNEEDRGGVADALRPIAPHLLPSNQLELGAARKRMMQAGYYRSSALAKYYVLRIILAILLPAITVVVLPQVSAKMNWDMIALLVAISGVVGLFLPTVWVSRRIENRQQQCRDGFPDA
ncbi:MAG: hypothetical protein OEO83_16770, partial [Alphaproteobacteria bacterium]|nr:hypothetical protein [Alphaproteobacteria bacterium]